MRLTLAPTSFKEAAGFIEEHHRHNPSPQGWKFGTAVVDETGRVRGVAMAGRPVARGLQDGFTLEVVRTCTDGAANANSMLYGAIRRAAKALGYRRLITYTLDSESGSSLKASGWKQAAQLPARSWSKSSKARPRTDRHTIAPRIRWEIDL